MSKNGFLRALRQIFAPTEFKCVCCGAELFENVAFCPGCLENVHFNKGKKCLRCGVELDGEENYCGNCAFDKIYFDKAYSVFNYDGSVRDGILQMKFFGLGGAARQFAQYLVYLAQKENLVYDVVTFAPMSAKSLRKRRYNQAQLLAEEFCDILSQRELLVDAITKIRETPLQETLSRTERKTNLVGSYRFKKGVDVKNKRVLLIDDIKTTGATINECAKVLKIAGATSVIGLTIASRKENFEFETNFEE